MGQVDVLAVPAAEVLRGMREVSANLAEHFRESDPSRASEHLREVETIDALTDLIERAEAYQAASGTAATFGEVRDARRELFAALCRAQGGAA